MRRCAGLAVFLLVVGCGKVGDPLPPFIRIPEPVMDLAVRQNGYNLVLTWTNPARNIDESAATDLSRVQIRSNDSVIANVNVIAAAKPQSHSIPVELPLGGERTFTVRLETTRGKMSNVSNAVSVVPVDVPGRVTGLSAVVDQRRITVQWDKPKEHPELVEGYVLSRTDLPAESQLVTETHYEDRQYEPGKTFTYLVIAVRSSAGGTIPGVGPESFPVTVEDKKAPRVPAGLDIIQSDGRALLTWDANEETDLAGYRVFRSERPDGVFTPVADRLATFNSYLDQSARPGLYYAVSAVDEFGNESGRSVPFRLP